MVSDESKNIPKILEIEPWCFSPKHSYKKVSVELMI